MVTDNEKKILELYKLPVYFDKNAGMVFDQENSMMMEVRGWGKIQYHKGAEELQDAMGEMFAKAFNEKYGK